MDSEKKTQKIYNPENMTEIEAFRNFSHQCSGARDAAVGILWLNRTVRAALQGMDVASEVHVRDCSGRQRQNHCCMTTVLWGQMSVEEDRVVRLAQTKPTTVI
ncbi:hypothetical protein VTO42DRAFT_547 [Malbranchea cinnamomea]